MKEKEKYKLSGGVVGKMPTVPPREHFRRALPHYQQPGQAYFLTIMLSGAIPKKALADYSQKLELITDNLKFLKDKPERLAEYQQLRQEYYRFSKKYRKAYDDLLDNQKSGIVNLVKKANTEIIKNALLYWESKRIENYAFCIMSNHIHWVFRTFEKDFEEKPVYLQEIKHSVKSFSANEINKLENRTGKLYHDEDFDTTIRNDKHLYNAIEYTILNPVKAGLVEHWYDYPGTWISKEWMEVFK